MQAPLSRPSVRFSSAQVPSFSRSLPFGEKKRTVPSAATATFSAPLSYIVPPRVTEALTSTSCGAAVTAKLPCGAAPPLTTRTVVGL